MGCCNESNAEPKQAEAGIKNILASVPPIMVTPYGTGLKCLESTLLPGTPVVIHDDGSIEYEPREGMTPPEISGYVRDEGNPFLFHPLWPTCPKRLHGTRIVGQGFLDVLMLCNCPRAEQHGQRVSAEVCRGCPHREG